ncbi:hypothetical protein BH24ACT26_BH24ACT26_18360 [soil metagenome]
MPVKDLVAGLAAGAVGTTALNITTYLDMALRGRSPSSIPEEAVKKFGESVGIRIAPREGEPKEVNEKAANRQSALGALAGFATGLTVGALYGIARSRAASMSLPAGAFAAGLGAMAFSDVPLVASGLTDPREWGAAGLASDLVPHLAYGFFTALSFDALRR